MKILILSLFSLLLLGCGQKGALQRPADVAPPVASTSVDDPAAPKKSP
ncbi:LPS translocon maturation chaperone LptM [Thioflexithrix psekupsensis]|nr:lipoprotein [Thioflexithrix psekupsensis]